MKISVNNIIVLGVFLFLLNIYDVFSQTFQVGIFSYNDGIFCKESPESFDLISRVIGGKTPYKFEWTFSWNDDTLTTKNIYDIIPDTSGIVKLTVTDNSHPEKSRDAYYSITEIDVSASFNLESDSMCAQNEILFNSVASNGISPYTYYWNFSDGNISYEKNPVHEFIAPGCSGYQVFNVDLEVRDANYCIATASKMVHVKNKPYLDFNDTDNPFSPFKHCHPVGSDPTFSVNLQNNSLQSSCISKYNINWGDGSAQTDVSFPLSHTYTEAGAFELTITAANTSGCSLVWKKFVYNQSSPAAGLSSYGGTEGCSPVEYAFKLNGYENNSIGTTYTWDFGDGSETIVWDSEQPFVNDVIKHKYENPSCIYGQSTGDYITTVTVNNGCGSIDATVAGVRVWTRPQASIDEGEYSLDTICAGESIQFVNNSTNGYYGLDCSEFSENMWDFDNGSTSTASISPPMSWSSAGEYDITLDVSNPCGTTRDTFNIVVAEPVTASATVDKVTGCAPFLPVFTNNSIGEYMTYSWHITPKTGYSFINGTKNTSAEPDISFYTGGSYRVILYATNVCGSDSVVFNFTVYSKPAAIITGLNDICLTTAVIHPSVVYNDYGKPLTSTTWNFTGGNLPGASTLDPGEHTYNIAGTYIVGVSLENECGNRYVTDTFEVITDPTIIAPAGAKICESDNYIISGTGVTNFISSKWTTNGDGSFSDSTIFNPVYYPGSADISDGDVQITITAEGNSPCVSESKNIDLKIQKAPFVQLSGNISICEGKEYTINDAIASNYDKLKWESSGNGYFSDDEQLITTYYPGSIDLLSGNVTITLTAFAIGPCSVNATESFIISYIDAPTINLGIDRDICEDGTVSLNATGDNYASLQWKDEFSAGSFSNLYITNPVYTLIEGYSGDKVKLTATAKGFYNCPDASDTVILSVIPFPRVNAGDDGIVCESGTFEIDDASVTNEAGYEWTVNGDGTLDDNKLINPVYTPGENDINNGQVTLSLIVEGKSVCSIMSDNKIITIQKLPVVNAGSDQDVCKINDFQTMGSQSNGVTCNWTSLGTGSFTNSTLLNTTYQPSETDKNNGNVFLVLKVNAKSPCYSFDTDTVLLTFIDLPEVYAGKDTTICAQDFTPLNVSVKNATEIIWKSSGSGLWVDDQTVMPTYKPSQPDIDNGFVNLTLTSTNPACPEISDELKLDLVAHPESYAGTDNSVCEDTSYIINNSSVSHNSSFYWESSGDGNFVSTSTLHAEYEPGYNDIENSSVYLYLISNGIAPCNFSDKDSVKITVQKNPVVNAGSDHIIGQGELFTITEATAKNYSSVLWNSFGDGNFINPGIITATYTHGSNDLLNKGVDLEITAKPVHPCIQPVSDTLILLITPIPKANAGSDVNICEGSDYRITGASAEEYSEIFWESRGNGVLQDANTFSPLYIPSAEDIDKREVVMVLNARGKDPITHYIAKDSMVIHIVHNAQVDIIETDTACENASYKINDIVYRDVNDVIWESSGTGYFNSSILRNPSYTFSAADRNMDRINLAIEVHSIAPCVYIDRDTMLLRIYHEPEPAFEYDPVEGCSPLSVNFNNISLGEELSYNWDFGNNLTLEVKQPGNVVFEQGKIADTTYFVTLSASNRCNTISTVQNVIVKPIPITKFGMDVNWGCSPKEINFFNVTTGLADTYLWKWGDGKPVSIDEQPGSHIFETEKYDTTYTITLIAENECGVDSAMKKVTIFPNNVTAFFETDTSLGCVPFEVHFSNYSRGVLGDEPFLNWSWNFGDSIVSRENSPTHIFTKPGKYKVTLYVNDTCSFDSFTTEITVFNIPKVDFTISSDAFCGYDSVTVTPLNMQLSALAGLEWDFGDTEHSYNYQEKHKYEDPGQYSVTLTATDVVHGCSANKSKNVTVYEVPVSLFTIPENDACQPLIITFNNESVGADYYSWDFGNGNKSIEINAHQVFNEPNTYNITLQALNRFDCFNTYSLPLKVNPKPMAGFEISHEYTCFPPIEVSFVNTSKGGDDFQWDFANGEKSKDTDPSTEYDDYGTYGISLITTNMFFCKDTASFDFNVYYNPVAEFIVDSTVGCDPYSVQFYNKSEYGVTYLWSFNDNDYSDESDPLYVFEGPGVNSVRLDVTGAGGCHDSIIKNDYITVNPSPTAEFDFVIVNNEDSVQFYNNSLGGISYIWDFGDTKQSDETEPLHRYAYGRYNVALTAINEYNCKNIYYDSVIVELLKGLFIPNAFSPDFISDEIKVFKAVGTGLAKFHLVIYDTWGNLIWETQKLKGGSPIESWDGTYKGKQLNTDVYVWHIKEAIYKDGSLYKGQDYGTITIIK